MRLQKRWDAPPCLPRASMGARAMSGGGEEANEGWTALHNQAVEGNEEGVRSLIASGADPNASDAGGGRPLYFASAGGHTATVSALIAAGADVNAQDQSDWTALHVASVEGHLDAVLALLAASGIDKDAQNLDGTP